MTTGRFISFEGPEGAGKSTQIKRLADALSGMGHRTIVTHEPGGTPLGERLRTLLLSDEEMDARAELLLMAADRAQHVATTIRPALAAGNWVLCDRYVDSTTAYQGGGLGLPAEDVAAANRLATAGLLPDLTVVLLLDPGEGLRRKGRRGDVIERRALEFHQRVYEAYRALCTREPERCAPVYVDGLRPDTVHDKVMTLVRERWDRCSLSG